MSLNDNLLLLRERGRLNQYFAENPPGNAKLQLGTAENWPRPHTLLLASSAAVLGESMTLQRAESKTAGIAQAYLPLHTSVSKYRIL